MGHDTEPATRRRIYEAIRADPGIHKSELCRVTGVSWGSVSHHLRELRKMGLVRATRQGGRLHLAAADYVADRRIRRAFMVPQARDILKLMSMEDQIGAAEIRDRLNLSEKLVRKHVRFLLAQGVIESDGAYHPRFWLAEGARDALELMGRGKSHP